jgi:prolyl oligopeptidase
VLLHRLGTSWRDDREIFGTGGEREDWPNLVSSADNDRWLLVVVSQGWARTEVFLLDLADSARAATPVITGVDAVTDGAFGGTSLFLRTNLGAPNYRVVRVDPSAPDRTTWREVVPERPGVVVSQVAPASGRLALDELERASSRIRLYSVDGTPEREVELPGLGTVGGLDGEWQADELSFAFSSFAQPSIAYTLHATSGQITPLAVGSWPDGLERVPHTVTQVWYRARDGTPVSMFLVHRPDLNLNGTAPTVLTGYGGFNVSRTPAFDSALQLWLSAGGVYALPNLRGGGEYGEAWHRAGMLANKQTVFDDFVAAAEWLIANDYTSPERLGIVGGSNGGLLVGAALTQRPELFKAVVCRVPLLDMLRYHLFGPARLWIAEYGSPDDPEQFAWLYAYSPYHRVRDGGCYPAVLLMAAEKDTRVDPLHARKMAARLQAVNGSAAPVLLRIETEAGHGVGKPRHKVVDELADMWSFLFWQLGLAPPAPRSVTVP